MFLNYFLKATTFLFHTIKARQYSGGKLYKIIVKLLMERQYSFSILYYCKAKKILLHISLRSTIQSRSVIFTPRKFKN